MDLLEAWAGWDCPDPPFVLDGDRTLIDTTRGPESVIFRSWPAVYHAPDFGARGDVRLHLGLIPQPFFGDLRHASIYLLTRNPGLSPTDYFGEYQVPGFRAALEANLRQDFGSGSIPFAWCLLPSPA